MRSTELHHRFEAYGPTTGKGGSFLINALGTLFFSLLTTSVWAAPTLTMANGSGAAGTTVSVPISFSSIASAVAAFQFDLLLPSGITPGPVTAGSVLLNTDVKLVATSVNPPDHPVASGTVWRFVVFASTAPANVNTDLTLKQGQNAVSAGTVVTPQLAIAPGTAAGTLTVQVSSVVYVDPSANAIVAGATSNGTITVTAGTGFSACDVNQDTKISGADAVLEVNMILGLTTCTADINNDSKCSGADYQRIVAAILGGPCVTTP